MADIRQANFRLDQAAADNFRKFCEENGYSQAEGFDYLMQLLAMSRTTAAAPGRKTEIEAFKKSIEDITQTYLNSVDLCTNAESRIRSQFEALILSKDGIISNLQEKADRLETSAQQATSIAEASAKSAAQAIKDATAAQKQADTAEQLCREKDETIATLKEKVSDYGNLKKGYEDAQERLVELGAEIDMLRRNAETQKRDADMALASAVMAKEREYMDKLRDADRETARLQAEVSILREQLGQKS